MFIKIVYGGIQKNHRKKCQKKVDIFFFVGYVIIRVKGRSFIKNEVML